MLTQSICFDFTSLVSFGFSKIKVSICNPFHQTFLPSLCLRAFVYIGIWIAVVVSEMETALEAGFETIRFFGGARACSGCDKRMFWEGISGWFSSNIYVP